MEGVSTVEDSQRKLAFWAAEVTYLDRATGPMLTAYAKVLWAERSAGEDDYSMLCSFCYIIIKPVYTVCVHVCLRQSAISVWTADCMSMPVKLSFAILCQICVNVCMDLCGSLNVVCTCQYVGGMLRSGLTGVCHVCYYMYLYICASPCMCLLICVSECVQCCGGGKVASVPHISHGVLLAGPSGGPLRFMECHSVAAAVNQVNVADPISSVVLRSRWKNNIWTAWFGPGKRLMPV